jgi:hypothetical protein
MRSGEKAFREAGARRSLGATVEFAARELLRSVLASPARLWGAARRCCADGAAGEAGGGVPPESLAEPALGAFDPESCEFCAEPMFASTWLPDGLVETCAEAVAGGADTLAEAAACDGATVTLPDPEAGGVVAVVEAETAVGAAWALAETDAEAAGVLALTLALAAGGAVETLTEADTGALGVAGVPGRPSACAGSAKDRHQAVPTPRTIKNRRKPRFRAITVYSLSLK